MGVGITESSPQHRKPLISACLSEILRHQGTLYFGYIRASVRAERVYLESRDDGARTTNLLRGVPGTVPMAGFMQGHRIILDLVSALQF